MKQKVVHLLRLASVLCLTLGLWCTTAQAQRGITVTGTVVDADGLPVIGAGVTLKGTTTGVAADADGKFTLVVPGETAVLEVSALGYVTEEVKVGKQQHFTIVLRDDTQSIEATVVVAYGTQTKATVTGALATIDNKHIRDFEEGYKSFRDEDTTFELIETLNTIRKEIADYDHEKIVDNGE